MKTIIAVIIILAVLGLLIWIFTKGSYGKKTVTSSSSSPEVMMPNSVQMVNFSFQPANLEVVKGTKVTWTNNDSTAHTVTSDTGVFNSDRIEPGKTYEFTFNDTGTFPYHCSIHTTMKANIIVK